MAAGGTTGWICLRNVNAGICVRSEGRRNQRPNGRPLSDWAQGLLHPSQHDQAIALTIALHLCLPLTPQRSAQLCKKQSLPKQARDRRPMSRSRFPRKTMRQHLAPQFNKAHTREKPRTHLKSDPVRKQVRRHRANDAEVALPDAAPRIMAHAASTDAAASVPDDYVERVARSRQQAANEQPPIFFFVIAVVLAVIGISIHFMRRLRFRPSLIRLDMGLAVIKL